MRKKLKVIGITILAVLVLCVAASKIYHEVRLKSEAKELQSYGVGKQIDIDGKQMNIYTSGDDNAENTIVYMQGLGMGDTTVSARPMLENIKGSNKICIIDRFGNGMSDDTNKDRTAENIVNEYRNILEKDGQKAPYILVAHSISGIYATYWAQHYPKEVKSIIYMDADPVEGYVKQGKADKMTLMVSGMEHIASSLGLQRFIVSDAGPIGDTKNQIFSEQQNEMRKKLFYHNTYSKATYKEVKSYYENAKTVSDKSMNFNIPQLYISADNVDGDYYKKVYADTLNKKYDGDTEKIQNAINKRKQIMSEKINYMKKRSNMEVVQLSGPHCIYEYNMKDVSQVISNFIEK